MRALTLFSERSQNAQGVSVIWIFERDGEIVRFETRFDSKENEYVLAVLWCGQHSQTIETYQHGRAFSERLRVLEQQLLAEGWSQIDNPQIRYSLHDQCGSRIT
jgi:hypothetical protein